MRYSLTDFSLGRISQVSGPVGVLPVAFPGVPVDNPVSSIHRSFGAGQCASSEGFLATFTPLRARCGEVVFSYPCSSSWIVFIHIPPQAGPREPRRRKPLRSPGRPPEGKRGDTIPPWMNEVRNNAMTSAPLTSEGGVLVALKPTDETASAPVETPRYERKQGSHGTDGLRGSNLWNRFWDLPFRER